MTKVSKISVANELFAANPEMSRKDFIALLIEKLGVNAGTASTYHALSRDKYIGKGTKVSSVKEMKTAKPVVTVTEKVKETKIEVVKKVEPTVVVTNVEKVHPSIAEIEAELEKTKHLIPAFLIKTRPSLAE